MKLAFTIIAVCICCSCLGQSVTGDLRGQLQDSGGQPVEGATVIINGPSIQGGRGATSSNSGSFVFIGLPVGDHLATITHVSFKEKRMTIRVRLGVMTSLGIINLESGETTLDTLTISGGRIPYKSEFNISLSKEVMNNLPMDRDYKNAITMLPQVNPSFFGDGLSINGSTGAENMFFLNGVNVTDNYSSVWAPTLNNSSFIPYNFIKEVSVKQSGYSAEYGRAIGGVVDVVTQSGTNHFKGQAFGYYSGSFLNAEPKEGATGATIGKISNYDFGISFSGPIIKDKLWYFAAYSFYENTLDTKVGGSFVPDRTTTHLGAFKLDWKTSAKTTVDFTLIADPTNRTPIVTIDATIGYVPATVVNPESMWGRTENGGLNLALMARTQLSERTQLEYGISGYEKTVVFGGVTVYGDTASQVFDVPSATVSGGIGYRENFSLSKRNFRFKVAHHQEKHSIKVGLEAEYNTQKGNASFPDQGNIIRYDPTYFEVHKNRNENKQALIYLASFYQHDWQLTTKVFLEVGIRWELQQMRLMDGTILQTFNNQWQPRLGLNWFVDERAKMKVSLNYGRVYQALPLNFNGFFYPGTPDSQYSVAYYSTDPALVGSSPDSTLVFFGGASRPQDKNIYSAPYNDQISLQFLHQVTPTAQWSARFLYKSVGQVFIVGSDFSASPPNLQVGNPGKGDMDFLPEVNHNYISAELGISGTAIDQKLAYGVYYVWSRNTGNYSGIWDSEARFFSGGSYSFSYKTTPERTANQIGPLPGDRTHSLKANASYRLGKGFTIGMNAIVMRGTPLNEYVPGVYVPWALELLQQRGTFGRLPILWDLNFRGAWQPKGLPLRVSMDVFHIGNPQTVVDQAQLKYTDQAITMLNPSYGQAVRRQQPMAVRFGIEYNF